MSKEHSTNKYEVLLISSKITKPEKNKESKYIFLSDISDFKQIYRDITKEKYEKILKILEKEESD